ncbi:MAG: DUF58 domain-containing protein [Phormidesmis priestleyi]|uniref:DUF58 domain-containing protein n=1 Tax=Phormidesmis priestleyi TaxID=268141 RepID=A0A2W4XIZ1_9CYAN|nr:MAG: DUF58 domain-containing protein [Phormidesmis priestleyi]
MKRGIYRLLRLSHTVQQWWVQRLTLSGLWLLGGIFMFGVIGLDVKRSLSYQVFAFGVALMGVAVVSSQLGSARLHSAKLRAVRSLPRFGTVGVPLRYGVRLHNVSAKRLRDLSLTERFGDSFPDFLDFQRIIRGSTHPKVRRKVWLKLLAQRQWAFAPAIALPLLAAKQETAVVAEIMPLRRGLLRFQGLTIACTDPLGLVNRGAMLDVPQSVLILPQRYQLPVIPLPGARRYQAGERSLTTAIGDSEEFRALRAYRPGDSVRNLHWKSWAKTGKPVIKEHQAEDAVRHALIVDTFQRADEDEWKSEGMEAAIAIAASFACDLQTQTALIDRLFMGTTAHHLDDGFSQAEQILTVLAAAEPCRDQDFSDLLAVVQKNMSRLHGCIAVFLDWDGDRRTLIGQLEAAGIAVLVLVIAGASGLSEMPDVICLRHPQSRLQVLAIDNIQAGLWAL